MNCDEFKDAIVAAVYGEPSMDDLDALRRHALRCPRCAPLFERTRELHGVLRVEGDITLPDKEASWRVIRDASLKPRWRIPVLFPPRRLATAAAVVAVVFAFGILVGRSVFSPGNGPTALVEENALGGASVAGYAETVELVLLDFMNRGGPPDSEEMTALTQRVAADMLGQTRVLKSAALREGDSSLYLLLEDIELVLISISNLGYQNGEVAEQLSRSIRSKLLLTRLRRLPEESATI